MSDGKKAKSGDKDDASEKPQGKLAAKLAGKMKYIIIAAVVLVLAGAGTGLYFMGFFTVHKSYETSMQLPGAPVYYEMKTMTVNLKPSAQRARPFIRLTLQVELQGESAKKAFIDNETKIVDTMQTHLRGVQYEELNGTEGTERLREDLTIIINRIIQPERAITVLYKDIFMR